MQEYTTSRVLIKTSSHIKELVLNILEELVLLLIVLEELMLILSIVPL